MTQTQIHALTEYLNAAGFKAKTWSEKRICLNGIGQDIKAYIDLDDPLDAAPGHFRNLLRCP